MDRKQYGRRFPLRPIDKPVRIVVQGPRLTDVELAQRVGDAIRKVKAA